MFVTDEFSGGNARILSVTPEKVVLDTDLRDTVGDWFFWCFKVSGAQGTTVEFQFLSTDRVGYYGPAVSYDMRNWKWQYDTPDYCGNSFTYTFSEEEDEVYFAHDMVYRPERFFAFAQSHNIILETLCISEKGRRVPYIDTKHGNECILLTARHHACESTGNYVLEGILENIFRHYADKFRIICVPFVDYDGVVDGDQGKNRNNHDHNRDYTQEKDSVYSAVARIREIAGNTNIRFAFDFHSPWHCRDENDTVFIPIKDPGMIADITEFSKLFEQENNPYSLPHFTADNIMPGEKWNVQGSPCFGTYFINKGAELSFTLETPYFTAGDVMFTPERAKETGRCFLRALSKYLGY